jgi:hypothetical protein
MQIIQQLRAGTVHFGIQPDGTEGFSTRPPSSLNLQAARALEELVQVCQGLERANQTLLQQLQQTETDFNAQRSLLQKFMADAEQLSAGAVPKHTETASQTGTSDLDTETGQTPGSA